MAKGQRPQPSPVSRPGDGPHVRTATVVAREGPLPSPDELCQFEQLVPGTAERIISMAEREQAARHNLEDMAQRAEIRHRDELVRSQQQAARGVFISDALGQVLGFIVAAGCVAGAIYTTIIGAHPVVPIAFLSLPVASIIKAVRAFRRNGDDGGR